LVMGCLAFLISTALLIVAIRKACDFLSEDFDSYYATYQEAVDDGGIKRGWIPEIVPESASEIRECHNIDTNETQMEFQFSKADLESKLDMLTETPCPVMVLTMCYPIGKRSWWPEDLMNGNLNCSTTPYNFYRYDYVVEFGGGPVDYSGYLAVDWEKEIAWYWFGGLPRIIQERLSARIKMTQSPPCK